jgi:hypothetical protein
LITFGDHLTVDGSGIVCRPFTTPTKSLHLKGLHAISEFDKAR